jgi:hypothetical protein
MDPSTNRWLLHDVIVGILGGGGTGAVVGLFVAVRVSDNNLITLIAAVVGAILATYATVRSHQSKPGLINITVGVVWFLLAASGVFIAALAGAIASFN